jgi:MoxR-like ATPase
VPQAQAVASPEAILKARKTITDIYVDEKIENYIVDIVMSTRQPALFGLKEMESLIEYGASPRASIYLTLGAKAFAFLRGRGYVTPEDVRAIGLDVLRHRIIPSYEAEAENIKAELTSLTKTVPLKFSQAGEVASVLQQMLPTWSCPR